ncbi:helix-turn-helix domain-containing protein [Candidatus Gracilibacteria bacterium]|nr:helix-turn-helix domain-containing protein [Candidatus Gracilibacteria bacterium]MCF7898344.1 helix-turn-helix domain-containing protein [Candidatus Paceibacterota bacterium]
MLQKTALSILKLGHTTFLTGAAGSGKSHVLREYITYLRKHGVRYAVTASTGIASTHINGTTIHAWSGIGIKQKLHSYDLGALEEKQNLYKRWNETQVLIIDEVSMLHASFVDMLDRVGKHMRRNEKPFGGMQVVFTGDFFQLPPVTRHGDEYESTDVFAFMSTAWKESKPVTCYLTEQFRQDDDKLSSILNAIRSCEVEEEHYEMLQEASKNAHSDDHIKLYTHNENVDQINLKAFNSIPGDIRAYHMITKGKAQLVAALKNNCLANEILQLKIGAKVICIKNAQDRSYVNGSMGLVINFDNEGAPIVELVSGKKITIKADSWKIEEDGKVKAELQQLPVKLAWAITVHKSQGMTLDKAEIDLSRAFASGQGYVALSRLKSLEGLYLKGFNPQALMIAEQVREADLTFVSKSVQAENAISKYTDTQLEKLQEKFITESGGTLTELDEIEDEEIVEKVASHTKTQEMLKEKLTIKEIADKRNVTVDTIIGHIEKLIELKEKVELNHTLPLKKDVTKITKTFKELKTRKLTPVFEHLKGKYTYQDIRIVRASINI